MNRYKLLFILSLGFSFICVAPVQANISGSVKLGASATLVGKHVDYVVLQSDDVSFDRIQQLPDSVWKHNHTDVVNLGFNHSFVALRVNMEMGVDEINAIEIAKPSVTELTAFVNGNLIYRIENESVLTQRDVADPHPIITLPNVTGICQILLIVKSKDELVLPIYAGEKKDILKRSSNRENLFGLFTGIMTVMMLYNFFHFLSLRTRIYFLYVLNILFLYLGQAAIVGYANKYFWPSLSNWPSIAIVLLPLASIVVGMMFVMDFLDIRKNLKNWVYVFYGVMGVALVGIVLSLLGDIETSSLILRGLGSTSALIVISLSLYLAKRGVRSAKFLFLAWSFFLIGVILYVLKDLDVLKYNLVTNYSMTIGSALETVLLSFALADRINTLKKEREESQRQMLDEMRKNRDLTENLNRELEQKVAERTQTLEITNRDLQDTLANLKSTQSQLLEAEKMASLGQLTAGIAHEINNPINFVSSNVEPLRNDFKDVLQILNQYQHYAKDKEDPALAQILSETDELDLEYSINEISQLIDGIEEGAKRTSEIVTGLKNFSRTDEEDLKKSDINEGLRSTIAILKSQLRSIKVNVDYGEIPYINCQLGKLNQVFMNIIDNSIDAIEDKYGESLGGVLSVRTNYADGIIRIEIGDNGNGIPDDVKKHIFDPFFTTKDVGKGTGLGLSISYGIIEKHNGSIEVHGESGVGTTFIITIPDDLKTNNGEQG
ncbi:MAG: hypothetical protein H6608_06100 [Flavobacteriales bacterium]|nr:hypothetical protein [Bacteroidota bacterium]MCB9240680.1 hypothetical protein [Flavobacteriales bacterium]